MEYLLSIKVAVENFSYFNTPFCCIGHSHIPLIFEKSGDDIRLHSFENNEAIELHGNRLIINPGGVGQPRDNDPRASYVLYDSEANTVRHFRVEYPVNITQAKMRDKKFSEFLIARLSQGC